MIQYSMVLFVVVQYATVWYGMIEWDTIHDMISRYTVLYRTVLLWWYYIIWYNTMQYDTIGTIQCGAICYNMIWYMIWYNTKQNNTLQYNSKHWLLTKESFKKDKWLRQFE